MAINQSIGILSFNLWSLLFSASLLLSVFLAYLIHFYTFCHWFLNKKHIVLHVITIPLILILFACVRYLLEEVLIYQFTGIHNYAEKTRIVTFYLRDNFFYGLPSVILSSIVFLFWEFQTYQKQNQILQLENKKAEFQLLKSQISPHFLFNTLNSFYSDWVEKDPETAKDF